jgi:four helix bundle protein
LVAWQKAIEFVRQVYEMTAAFPHEEMFGLKSQMRRSAVSVPSNIAEGQGRTSRGEFLQFLGHARGSLYELETQIVIAETLGYIAREQQDRMLQDAQQLGRILNGLIGSLKSNTGTRVHRQLTTDN